MIFAVGTKVSFLHTGENGVITEILGGNMVNVLLANDDMEIPSHIEDLISIEQGNSKKEAKKTTRQINVKPSVQPPKKVAKPLPKVEKEVHRKQELGYPEVCSLAFVTLNKADGEIYAYELYLVNHTAHTLVYQFSLEFLKIEEESGNGKLSPYSYKLLGKMHYLQLNDSPSFSFMSKVATTEDREEWVKKQLKIKASSFFKKEQQTPLLNCRAYLYTLRDAFAKKNKPIDLAAYTKENAPKSNEAKPEPVVLWGAVISPKEVAEFPSEIDLHIEKLSPNHARLSNAEILHIQLRRFDEYMRKALRSSATSALIIHGKGKGRLKTEVLYRLKAYPEVTRIEEGFKAGGATMIYF